jgi:hypothetical protein
VGTLKRYSKALDYEYIVKTAALGTLKRYSILSLTLYLEWYCAYSILPQSQKECRFRISDILFDHPSYSNFFINIIYFVMTYFIIRDPLIMIYLFYNLHRIFE